MANKSYEKELQKQIKKSLKFKKKKRKTIKIRLLTDYKKRHSINE